MKQEELKQAIDDILEVYGKYFEKQYTYKPDENKYTPDNLKKLMKFLYPYRYHSDKRLNLKENTLTTIKKKNDK